MNKKLRRNPWQKAFRTPVEKNCLIECSQSRPFYAKGLPPFCGISFFLSFCKMGFLTSKDFSAHISRYKLAKIEALQKRVWRQDNDLRKNIWEILTNCFRKRYDKKKIKILQLGLLPLVFLMRFQLLVCLNCVSNNMLLLI